MRALRIIIAAGGTGGHVFPALALAEEIRNRHADAEILFVGTKRGLEDKVIPASGFKLITITMSGLARSFAPPDVLQNLFMPFRLVAGLVQSLGVLRRFKPDAVIGCGGYVSGPVVLLAAWKGIKTLVQEQNSRPGRTTVMLSKFVDEVHLTYEEAAGFFGDRRKIRISGNPLRKGLRRIDRKTACKFFGIDENKKTLLVVGGSLGAHAINAALLAGMDALPNDTDVLWQTGENDLDRIASGVRRSGVKVMKFIDNMSMAYSCADLILCRAGAMTIAELTHMGLPAILVPYPYAADNHQEFNARSLVSRGAAVMIRNSELPDKLMPAVTGLINAPEALKTMGQKSFAMRREDAAKKIIDGMTALIERDV